MALNRSVMKDDDILCAFYVDTYSDDCKAEILDSDSDIPTTAPHKHFQSVLIFC
jgi:hypothetical protein